MDDPSHALICKRCFECSQWALLTEANWPKSSLEDPAQSCCRSCDLVKNSVEGVEESFEDKLKIVPVYDSTHDCMIKTNEAALHEEMGDLSSSSYILSEQGCYDILGEEGISTSDKMVLKKPEVAQSTMASRWATPTAQPKCPPSKALAEVNNKEWFLKRDDLFNGEATVDNAAPTLFKTMSVRAGDKKGKASGAKESDKKTKQRPAYSSLGDGSKKHNNSPVRLTGANILAGGGDNGWGNRGGARPTQGHNVPEMQVPRWMVDTAAMEKTQQSALQKGGIHDHSFMDTLPFQEMSMNCDNSQNYSQVNQGLLETIARLQHRHEHLLTGASYRQSGLEGF